MKTEKCLLTDDGSNFQKFSSERSDVHTQDIPQALWVYIWGFEKSIEKSYWGGGVGGKVAAFREHNIKYQADFTYLRRPFFGHQCLWALSGERTTWKDGTLCLKWQEESHDLKWKKKKNYIKLHKP